MALDAETAMYVWTGVFIVGLVVFFMGVFRKHSPIKINPVLGAVAGICLILPGFIWGIYPNVGSPGSPIQTTPVIITPADTTSPPATFDITIAATAATNYTDDDLQKWTTFVACDTYDDAFNTTTATQNFSIVPIAPQGVNTNDLATIYFETEYNKKFNGEYLLHENNGVFGAVFTGDSTAGGTTRTWRHEGTMSMTYTDVGWTNLTLTYSDEANGIVDETSVGDAYDLKITFHNADWSWSKVYTFTVMVNAVWTTNAP